MPRVGDPITEGYPWAEWRKLLDDAPTQTLYFVQGDDFRVSPQAFASTVKRRWPDIRTKALQGEVMVTLAS